MRKKKRGKDNTKGERLLINLHSIVKENGPNREKASSLVNWYLANQFWTEKQIAFVKSLVQAHKIKKSKAKPKKYKLYAISDGEAVKLGISVNIGKRLKQIQTGHPKPLKVLWKLYAGATTGAAYKTERKLHRLCSKYRVRGEWFKPECMDLVREFTLKEK